MPNNNNNIIINDWRECGQIKSGCSVEGGANVTHNQITREGLYRDLLWRSALDATHTNKAPCCFCYFFFQ